MLDVHRFVFCGLPLCVGSTSRGRHGRFYSGIDRGRPVIGLQKTNLAKRFTLIFRSMVVGGVAVFGLSLMSAPLIAGAFILIIGGSTALFMPIVWGVLQEITPAPLPPVSSRPSALVPWQSQWPAWPDSAGLPIPWGPTSV